jgi:hypothetical protein
MKAKGTCLSRSKQATQTPMFPGLPSFCTTGAIMPIKAPTLMIPHLEAKIFFTAINLFLSFPQTFYKKYALQQLFYERHG